MHCELQSEQGGYSQLISASKILDYIKSINYSIVPELFIKNTIKFKRKSPSGNGIFNYSKELFINTYNGKIGINYNPIMFEIQSSIEVENCLRLINYYTNNPINQTIFKLKPKEILIVDNQQYLHGRSCFPVDSKRKMQRLWYEG